MGRRQVNAKRNGNRPGNTSDKGVSYYQRYVASKQASAEYTRMSKRNVRG